MVSYLNKEDQYKLDRLQQFYNQNKVKRLRNNGYLVNTYETLDIWNIKHYWYETNL